MKKTLWLALVFLLVCVFAFAACDDTNQSQMPNNNHVHAFGEWTTIKKASCADDGTNERYCTCGEKQIQSIAALGHQETVDAAVAATCTADGKSEGKHCSVCGEVLVAQTVIDKLGHTEVVDAAIAATCTSEGKTEGKHCSVCSEILVKSSVISATGHKYNSGEITKSATCVNAGTKKYTCTNPSCNDSYTESYSLPQYTATELYNQSIKYVGEIVTYDKNGDEAAIGTGFVISSDGKIVTNYHVIEGAYSAKISINGKTYNIASVLAYDANIDLAVLKINANNLTAAKVCKNALQAGATVYAIGSSRGLTNTYSQGIITYADRIVDGVSHVQHDASITHGNSGGPLINVYGEVIGINTWGISDSQNLNFAVFADELDNLTYGTPLTLSEFYLKECDAFEKIKNYIIDNGNYDADGNYYSVVLSTTYSSDYTSKHTRMAYYYVDDNEISLDYVVNNGEYWVYFIITEDLNGKYDWCYFDYDDYNMRGVINAATYDDNSLLGYSYNNISYSDLRAAIREVSSTMVSTLCMYISTDFATINVTADDLGFYCY